jgi:signal transduction histidine kinase
MPPSGDSSVPGHRYPCGNVSTADLSYRFFAPHPRRASVGDALVAAAALAGSLVLLTHGGFGFGSARSGAGSTTLDPTGGLLVACSTLPLAVWRRAPRLVFVGTASAAVLLAAAEYPVGLTLGPTVALFLLAASRSNEDPWTRRDTTVVVGSLLTLLGATAIGQHDFPWSTLLHTGLAWAVAWFAGDRTRLLHEHLAELSDRAHRAERDGERDRRLAVAEERARIARDLHDTAAHAINVIAIRAGAARLRGDPSRSQATLADIEGLARKTAGEIDQIVGALRDRSAAVDAVDAPLGLASLDTLLAHHAASGLDVRLDRRGEPHDLDPALDQAAYRILQEALTNAARHGTGAARVTLDYGTAALDLTIANPAPIDGRSGSRRGHGVIGMRERAELLGGILRVERAEGSFCVYASLPYGGPTA